MCWWGWNSGEGEREKKTGGRRQQLPFLYIREHISVDLHSKNACLIKRRLMHGNASEITPWRAGGRHKPPIIPLLPLKKSNHSLHCGSTCTKCNWLYTLRVPQFSVNNADKALHRDKRTQQSVHPLFFRNKATAYSSQGDTSTASVRARRNAARKSRERERRKGKKRKTVCGVYTCNCFLRSASRTISCRGFCSCANLSGLLITTPETVLPCSPRRYARER